MQPNGNIAAILGDYSVNLGQFSAAAMDRARHLSTGLPFASFAGKSALAKDVDALVRRLARQGLLEYRLSSSRNTQDFVVIEPQVPEYWPRRAKLGSRDTIVLSRFAFLRRRGNELVLESPRAGALFRIGDPAIAATLAALSQPRKTGELNQKMASPTLHLLELLLDSQILLKLDAKDGQGLRANEGDGNLVLWDFHDLVFHTRSTEGRQASPVGAAFTYAGVVPPSPAVRPPWAGSKIDLHKFSSPEPNSRFPKLLRERHSTRDFDDKNPVTLGELAQFLDTSARVLSEWKSEPYFEGGPDVTYSTRPYPSAGSAYELELYLTVANCDGLARGLYHYDAGSHALVAISASPQQLQAHLTAAQFAMDAPGQPQILITMAARFGRVSWKYSSIAYSLILKDVGSLIQTLYLAATDMGLGGCAIGSTNIDLFAKMTELEFHIEGPVGQFALGRGRRPEVQG
ncbi:SagB/ThcOx family dehydrogenase [Bradyrhizobium japonicum]|uniref:SagB/ThcOx family dehydrogenase n=1 Tax=Bradyrhizobium japonicum TaxID=375 RepID=UPI000580A26C|nr:SagB family peptide dehydrogenase [Bradyrhizobium japonicum]MCD9112873.1 SagB family peptide dehydrogenase [Bradyrhizobium japonicum]MCD9259902.1 SagB family peptide dehydrogenase [Bradyrhizobium japonicum SEMIA 5079]MCD9825091.1 SagB family peptide dehydrogenase [Bradyrhizobium japonicum]MCD9897957.1 SagB family peptide dehydrogenase [Bradyrhizobium japonicum]MCD9913103.1 SagB family peptide dehydrogenase [Bradyrhizobium japonicum]